MNIIINRYRTNKDSIDGVLKIAGVNVCDTAENAAACIPTGTYKVLINTCKHYRRKMPVILVEGNHKPLTIKRRCRHCPKCSNVSNNSNLPIFCPQIKIGNGVRNRTDGSIIIGEYICPGCLKHPRVHFNRLIDRLDKAQRRGYSISLTIKDIKS